LKLGPRKKRKVVLLLYFRPEVLKEIPTKEYQRIGDKSKASSIPTGLVFLKMLLKEIFN